MRLNINHTMNNSQFESGSNLRFTAKQILCKEGVKPTVAEEILNESVFFNNNGYKNFKQSEFNIATQIALNNSLKETLKHLRTRNVDKKEKKTPVFGEIWDSFKDREIIEDNNEILEFVIDNNVENIFAA